jgi:hypothetical protein
MNDELRNRLQAIDPMPADVPTETVTSREGRLRLEDIMSTPTKEQPSRTTRSRTPWYAAVAAVAVAAVAVTVIATGSNDPAPVASAPMQLAAGESDAMASCIVLTSEVLAPVEVAFAGTVTAIDGETVTLEVTKWYVGGDTDTVVLTAPAGLEALIGSVPFAVGENFLVSATEGVVNYCGFSGPATADLQAIYDGAFSG